VGESMPPLAHADNSLIVHYLAPNSMFTQSVSFEVQLEGSGKGWLSAGKNGAMTFNHLAAGEYKLRVRPRVGDQLGAEAAVSFKVLAPWYRSKLAYAMYVVLFAATILFAGWLSAYVSRREKMRLEKLIASRTGELHTTNQALSAQIEESLRKTEALRISEDRYRRLSDNAPDIIFRLNVQPVIAFDYISPAVTRIAGYRPEDFLADARFPQKIVQPPGSETVYDFAVSQKIPLDVRTVQWRTHHGHIVTIEERLSPTYDASGMLLAIEGIARDITQTVEEQERRRRLEAQLLQSQKLESVGTLAGGIAHDFNNILTGILGYCELAMRSAANNMELLGDLGMIKTAGMRAKNLVAQILTFSRKNETKLVAVNLAAVVREAVQLIRATTPATISIVSECSSGVVLADATQVHQIVINLCTNAVQAMGDKPGQLTITVKPVEASVALVEEMPGLAVGPYLCLSVSDTGCGMDAATLARSFDPFFTTKQPGKGTGLGLSAVQGIVAGHHGGLRVHSTVDVGTTFEIYFPRAVESSATEQVTKSSNRGQQQHILVVDDERAIADFVSVVLRNANYRVTSFYDAQAALTALIENSKDYQAIVTDMTMPHFTGLELITRLRAQGINLPSIVITGYSKEILDMDKNSLQNIVVLGKPFSSDDITQALAKLLEPAG
jgi:two-component system, cell cycle sensor histidine kinase and response regulator CckA